MIRTLAATAMLLAAASAQANEQRAYAAAEAAIADFRDVSFLPTACETAFSDFWKAFRVQVEPGFVYLTNPFGTRQYFGYGNPGAEDMLVAAQAACRDQAGEHGDMVLHVLRDRALEKERRIHQFEHAERVIGN
ncbi:MAG: hypothetical protein AAF409_07660 [Pseudomonadota bacterium]